MHDLLCLILHYSLITQGMTRNPLSRTWVWHLNAILAQGRESERANLQILKSQGHIPGGGGGVFNSNWSAQNYECRLLCNSLTVSRSRKVIANKLNMTVVFTRRRNIETTSSSGTHCSTLRSWNRIQLCGAQISNLSRTTSQIGIKRRAKRLY